METAAILKQFLEKVKDDPRIRTTHIAVYMALYQHWIEGNCPTFILVKSQQLMPLAKVSSSATWHSAIRALDEYGYICYQPSFNRMTSSKVMMLG
ncbi:hypothetical protein [Pedobacter foliorum]|uniref:hypothetical protein n=1 Tax=Pedobacter foliorum TaxID=2739058 RepID=UPI0015632411|nr:hypothetical protein [Pedobacter foliorum]NRF41096.1 hypothetical protein [Pedobacter foliorum]